MGDSDYSVGDLYRTEVADWDLHPMLNRRRTIISPVPGMDITTHDAAKREMLEAEGFGEYADELVCEAQNRPIVEASAPGEYGAGFAVYRKWFPRLLKWMVEHARPEHHSFNAVSRLGSNYCCHVESKRDELMPKFRDLAAGSDAALASALEGLYTLINVRLQSEKKDRVRSMTFVNSEGRVYRTDIGRAQRHVSIPRFGIEGAAKRTRTIFMPCYFNLATQFVDQALHSSLLRTRACEHNMFAKIQDVLPRHAEAYMFTDVRHMDRHTGECASFRAECIGGHYATGFKAMFAHPFLVPADDWSEDIWVWVTGVPQFPSGFSAVANLQKEYFLCLYCEFAHAHLGMTEEAAMAFVLAGGDSRFTIRNYGDDNALAGTATNLGSWFDFATQYCALEREDPAKFLGFVWDDDDAKFYLTRQSYLLKTWLNERQPHTGFRPRPYLGWTLKRKTYAEYGKPGDFSALFERENALLERYGVSWDFIETEAAREAKEAAGEEYFGYLALGKPYLLTAEERARTPGFELVDQAEATALTLALIGSEWKDSLYGSQTWSL